MTDTTRALAALQRLIEEDAIGQLRRRDGLMAQLGSENGDLKLDWVEGIARLLAHPTQLEEVEAEALDLQRRGLRHLIWAGMGGSVITVRVLCELGFGQGTVTVYPLDSTDPTALNKIVRRIANAEHLELPAGEAANDPAFLSKLLEHTMMIGVAMGMTSEEPITHLEWFTDLLKRAGLSPAEHLLVMALPDSYLDRFAREQEAPCRPLQPDGGTGTGGRMSAPSTRVFLLPAALYLTGQYPNQSGLLRQTLQRAWNDYDLDLASSRPAEHPYVQLAAALSANSLDDACRLLLEMPAGWQAFFFWLEQLMEESLGKGGKGIVVFREQELQQSAPAYQPEGMLHVKVVADSAPPADEQRFLLAQPSFASQEPQERLAAVATSFLGWQLSMALYGYLHQIQFSGQPAVENYKARARALRTEPEPLQVISQWQPSLPEGILTLLAPQGSAAHEQAAKVFASALRRIEKKEGAQRIPPAYLDITVNGEAQATLLSLLDGRAHNIANNLLGIPIKLRTAPADYHSTEQSEMDGPPSLVSLRLVARHSEAVLLGSYTTTFLHAQAVSTWQAMLEAGRPCFLMLVDGDFHEALAPLAAFFSQVEEQFRHA